ncbi:MAG: hypothetical protein KC426_02945 [Oceanospirillaceae bacterium]|nr:hypothetical protein [Oceanospirillaceae bacterium]
MTTLQSKEKGLQVLQVELEKALNKCLEEIGEKSHELSWFSSQEEAEVGYLSAA